MERECPVYLPEQIRLKELKSRANALYKEINEVTDKYKTLSKEYVTILKEIEDEIVKPRF